MGFRLSYYEFLLRQGPVPFSKGIPYARFIEYPRVVEALQAGPQDTVLDVGSRYSPFPQVLATQFGCSVVAVDPEPGFRSKQMAMAHRVPAAARAVRDGKLDFLTEDAGQLSFPDDHFSRISAISVLEHIVDESQVVRELARVLRPGGRFVISVPYDPWRDEPKYYRQNPYVVADKSREEFFMRFYNDENLRQRLIKPSGLSLVSTTYFGEPGFNAHNLLYGNPRIPWPVKRLIVQPLVPILAPTLIKNLEPRQFRHKTKIYTADTAVVVLTKP
ncbi:MAG: class I SAM-dependent methyltransferase [Candidatus Eisenbacteria bacterium]